MNPDPKWLEILKASGWQTGAIAIACGAVLAILHAGWLPSPGAVPIFLLVVACAICACLAVASMLSGLFKFLRPDAWIVHWRRVAMQRKAVRDYIPHMTEEERGIIGYLLANNQKMFTGASDGGHATTLISRGIVVMALRPGQVFTDSDTPFTIPDHIWDVLHHHRDQFPPPEADGTHPWRVHWMAR